MKILMAFCAPGILIGKLTQTRNHVLKLSMFAEVDVTCCLAARHAGFLSGKPGAIALCRATPQRKSKNG